MDERALVAKRTETLNEENKQFVDYVWRLENRQAFARTMLEEKYLGDKGKAKKRQEARETFYVAKQLVKQRKAMAHVKSLLLQILKRNKLQLYEMFGRLKEGGILTRNEYVRHIPVWAKAPQVAIVKVDFIRAVKDKLPAGQYVLSCTIYDRLGGYPLRWSKLKKNHAEDHKNKIIHTAFTKKPITHEGQFFNLELNFSADAENDLYLAIPAQNYLALSMCLAFELFRLRRGTQYYDAVLAWGAFPLCGSDFELNTGSFKIPMLRGEMNPTFDKYSTIQNAIENNLDAWLGNMYFQVYSLDH
jgi:hypothetical protein